MLVVRSKSSRSGARFPRFFEWQLLSSCVPACCSAVAFELAIPNGENDREHGFTSFLVYDVLVFVVWNDFVVDFRGTRLDVLMNLAGITRQNSG